MKIEGLALGKGPQRLDHSRRRLLQAGCAAVLAWPFSCKAHEYYARQFVLIHPWTDPTVVGEDAARVHFRLESITGPDRLLGGRFAFCQRVELRRGLDDQAQALAAIDIAPAERMDFVPDGVHVLLKGLMQPLQADRSYPLELDFEVSGTLVVMLSMSGSD